jgi:hypothetical protein
LYDGVVIDEELSAPFFGTVAVEGPVWGDHVDVEGAKEGLFDVVWEGHDIFDGVQTAKNEVEQANLEKMSS